MNPTRRSIVFGIPAAILTAGVSAKAGVRSQAPGLTLSEVVARHTVARGGAHRLDTVKAAEVYPIISEKGSTLEARYLCSDAPAWRIDIYVDHLHVFAEGLDGKGPWLWPGGDAAPHDAVPDARRTGIQGIEFNLFGLHRFPSRGHHLFLHGQELIDGIHYYVIRVLMKDSYETFLYINPHSWMIERRRDYRAFHPDVDAKKAFAENVYGDFRTTDGIVSSRSERQVNWKTGELINSTIVRSIAYNPIIPAGTLDRNFQASKMLATSSFGSI